MAKFAPRAVLQETKFIPGAEEGSEPQEVQVYSPLGRAVSVALLCLQASGAPSWSALLDDDELMRSLAAKIDLNAEEVALLDEYAEVLTWVSARPKVTVAICDECGEYLLTSSTSPSACTLTKGCAGKPEIVKTAKRVPLPKKKAEPSAA